MRIKGKISKNNFFFFNHSNRSFLLTPWNTSRSTLNYLLPDVHTYVANSVTKSRKLPLGGSHDPVGDDFTRRVLHVDGRVGTTGNVVGKAVSKRRVVNRGLCSNGGGSGGNQDEKPHHVTPMVMDGRWRWRIHKNKTKTIQTRKIAWWARKPNFQTECRQNGVLWIINRTVNDVKFRTNPDPDSNATVPLPNSKAFCKRCTPVWIQATVLHPSLFPRSPLLYFTISYIYEIVRKAFILEIISIITFHTLHLNENPRFVRANGLLATRCLLDENSTHGR